MKTKAFFVTTLAALGTTTASSGKSPNEAQSENCMPYIASSLTKNGIPSTVYTLEVGTDTGYAGSKFFNGKVNINFGSNTYYHDIYEQQKKNITQGVDDGNCRDKFYAQVTDSNGKVISAGSKIISLSKDSTWVAIPIVVAVAATL